MNELEGFHYHLVIGLIAEVSADRIITILVKRGYTVSALSNLKKICETKKGNVCAVLALYVSGLRDPLKDKSGREMLSEDVRDILEITKTKFFMFYIGYATSDATWMLGNVFLKEEQDKTETKKEGLN